MKNILNFTLLAFALILSSFTVAPMQMAHAATLVMIDSYGCPSCRKFKRETAAFYRRSRIGKKYPLRIVNIDSRQMKRLRRRLRRPVHFTPTFIIMRSGKERSRFVGYRSRAHFMRTMARR